MPVNGRKIQLKSVSHIHTVCQHQGSPAKCGRRGLHVLLVGMPTDGASILPQAKGWTRATQEAGVNQVHKLSQHTLYRVWTTRDGRTLEPQG